jgi:cell division protein FtsB
MDFRLRNLSKLRALPRPEEGLRALAERAPGAEAWVAGRATKVRPLVDWLYIMRRRIATTTVAVVTILLFLHVMFGANGMVVYRQKKSEYETLQKELDTLQKENQRYTKDIKGLKTDPGMMEKEAREQLHYARPGEVVYVAPQPPPPAEPPTRKSAAK